MSKIKNAFAGGKAFIPFITCGDPDLETTERLVKAMAEAGADMIELGIPFSDPTAEGPVIQAASARALEQGVTTDRIFGMVERLRKNVMVPLVFMPFEEKEEFEPLCKAYGLDLISMVAPTSRQRIQKIAKEAKGFIYVVSSLGVTGMRNEITTDLETVIRQIRAVTDTPCAVGFGISTPEQAGQMGALADGVIVGSAIVKLTAEHGRGSTPYIQEYVRIMKAAVNRAAG